MYETRQRQDLGDKLTFTDLQASSWGKGAGQGWGGKDLG
jgi:hypothetical protein